MKTLIVFGAGDFGSQLARMLDHPDMKKSLGDLEIKYFSDNDRAKWGSYVCGIPVLRPKDMLEHLEEVDGVCISSPKIVDDVMKQLLDMGVKSPVYLTPSYVYEYLWGLDMPPLVEMDITKPRLPVLEYTIVAHCILKCKGCLTASNVRKEFFDDPDWFEKQVKRIKELFSGVRSLRILGGEPLLHERLLDFIYIARRAFPDAELVIISNGLLIPNCSNSFLRAIHKMDAIFSITVYQPTGVIKKKIIRLLSMNQVKYEFRGAVYVFRKSISLKKAYCAEDVFANCPKCPSVVNGILACEKYQELQIMRECFDIDVNDCEKGLAIDIFQTKLNGWEINDFLSKPSQLCAHCALYSGDPAAEFPWVCNHTKAEVSDWILE